MAAVCYAYKYTPSQYWELNSFERNALVKEVNRHRKKD